VRRCYLKTIVIFECSYVMLVAVLVAVLVVAAYIEVPRGGEGSFPIWAFAFASLPLAYLLKATGMPAPGWVLISSTLGRITLFLFYAVVVATSAVLARHLFGPQGTK